MAVRGADLPAPLPLAPLHRFGIGSQELWWAGRCKANHQVPTPPGTGSQGQGAWCGSTSLIDYVGKWLCHLPQHMLQLPWSGSRESTGQSPPHHPLCGGKLDRHLPLLSAGTAGAAWDSRSSLEKPKLGRRVTGHLGQAGHPLPLCAHLRAAEAPPAQRLRGAGLCRARRLPAASTEPARLAKALQGLCSPPRCQATARTNSGKERRPTRCQGWGELPARQGWASTPGGGTPDFGQAAGKHPAQAAPTPHFRQLRTPFYRFLGTFQTPSQGWWVIPASSPRTPPWF